MLFVALIKEASLMEREDKGDTRNLKERKEIKRPL